DLHVHVRAGEAADELGERERKDQPPRRHDCALQCQCLAHRNRVLSNLSGPLAAAAIAKSAAEAKGVGRASLEALSLLRVGVTAPAVVAIPLLPRPFVPDLISPSINVD